jgi:hypothetical protein
MNISDEKWVAFVKECPTPLFEKEMKSGLK